MSKQTDLINIPDAITVSGSNVGIGTSSPQQMLDIDLAQASETILRVGNTSTSAGSGAKITAEGSSNKSIDVGIRSINDPAYGALDAESGYVWYDGATSLVLGATNSAGIIKFNTGGIATERMRIDASGNVGINTDVLTSAAQSGKLKVRNDVDYSSTEFEDNATLLLQNETPNHSATLVFHSDNATGSSKRAGIVGGNINSNTSALGFYGDIANKTSATKPDVTVDSSGNLLVGKTSTSFSTAGSGILSDGEGQFVRSGNAPINAKRLSTAGNIIGLYRDSVNVGSIGTWGSTGLYIGSPSATDAYLYFGNSYVAPSTTAGFRDNAIDLGNGSARFDDIFATNPSITTSDATEKQDIASLTATEMLVGKRISTLFKTFRWKDSVAEKGDNARTHTGVIAQDVQAAFTAEGLDAGDYALFISDTWWTHDVYVPAVEADEDNEIEAVDAYTRTDTYDTEAEAPEGATSKTRLGIRYPELLSFVAAYNEQRFASIEARLTALEA